MLDLERRIREARADAAARSVGRAGGARGFWARLSSRSPVRRDVWVADFRDRGDDVWAALRF